MSRRKWHTREQRIQRAWAAWRREWRFWRQWVTKNDCLGDFLSGQRRYPRAAQYLRAFRAFERHSRESKP